MTALWKNCLVRCALRLIRKSGGKSGQAMVEMMVAIVAMLVLIAGLLQVASLSTVHTRTMVEARSEAGQLAMLDSEPAFFPEYIRDWHEGDDGKRYTKDDTFDSADPSGFQNTIVSKASGDTAGWVVIDSVPDNELTQMHDTGMPQREFALVRGEESDSVDLLPAVQSLIYDAPSVTVGCEAWMTWTKGIY